MKHALTIHPVPMSSGNFTRYWYQNNPVKSHYYNALSTLFPQGENFFIWSIKNFSHHVTDATLEQKIKDFVTQEKNHAALHKSFNRKLARSGYDIAWMEKALQKKLSFSQTHLSPLTCLAITVATEHITAVLGEKILEGQILNEGVDPEVRQIWIWHAMEEVDHKSVAMDVYQLAGGTYGKRCRALIIVSFNFWSDALLRMLHMLKKDGLLWKPRTWWQIADLLLGRKGVIPLMTVDILKYFSRSFHPDLNENYDLVERGRNLLLAASTSRRAQQ